MSADSIGQAGGVNVYGYAGNSPIGLIDPFGQDAISIVYAGYPIRVPGTATSLPLGHAATVAVNEKTGFTKYYEYGRYDADFGKVRSRPVPNVQIGGDGKPTSESLRRLYDFLSKKCGKDKPVVPQYYDDADFDKVVGYAEDLMRDANREPYSIPGNTCYTFSDDAIDAGRPPLVDRIVDFFFPSAQ